MPRTSTVDPAIERERTDRQRQLDQQRTQLERNQLGQFATPPELADEIIKCVLTLVPQKHPIRFLEPSIGSGSFYSALLNNCSRRTLAEAVGIEIDNRFADLSRDLWGATGLRVIQQDFLETEPQKASVNLVAANPPYVRHHHLGADKKQMLKGEVQKTLGINISGLAGLYCYFVLLADQWLDKDCVSAWLIPSEFMDVNYGLALRRYLTERVTLHQIHRYSATEDKFDDALVSSAVVIFQKQKPKSSSVIRLSFGGHLESPSVETQISNESLAAETRWTRLARPNFDPQHSRVTMDRSTSQTIGDLFSVKRGIATGANAYFILPKDEAKALEIPEEALKPILPSPRYLKEEVIESDEYGYPNIQRKLSLLDCRLSEDSIMREHPGLWSYLVKGKDKGIPAGYLVSRREPWYSQETRHAAPFLCSYMGRSEKQPFRFFWNKSDAIAANVYLMLYPKPQLATEIDLSTTLSSELFDMFSAIEPEDFFDEGRVYGGGLFKMEPAELKRLPVKGLQINLRSCTQTLMW